MLPQDILLAPSALQSSKGKPQSQFAHSHSHGTVWGVCCIAATPASSHSFLQLPIHGTNSPEGRAGRVTSLLSSLMTKSLFQHGMEKKCYLFLLKGPKPSKGTKTLATFDISSAVSKEGWSAVLQSSSSSSVSISISSPHNAVIGRYRLSVQSGSSSPQSLGTFVLLFNPWSSGMNMSNFL